MRKVNTFIHVFVNSLIPQAHYYPKILHTNFFFSLRYYVFLLFIFNIIFLLTLPFKYYPNKFTSRIDNLISSLQKYPKDLIITINNGTMITNYDRPYFLWYDYENKKKLLLAVDESGSVQNSNLKPLFLLTSKNLMVYSTAIPVSNLKINSVNKQKVNTLINTLKVFNRLLPLFMLAIYLWMFLLVPLGSFIINTLYILIASLIAYAVFIIFVKHHISFKKTFQVSLHAVTLPLIIDYALIIFKPTVYMQSNNIPRFSAALPLLFLILLSIFIFGGIYEAHWHHIKK